MRSFKILSRETSTDVYEWGTLRFESVKREAMILRILLLGTSSYLDAVVISGMGRSIGVDDAEVPPTAANTEGATAAAAGGAAAVGAEVGAALILTRSGMVSALSATKTSPLVTRPPFPLPCSTVASLPLDSARWRAEGSSKDGVVAAVVVDVLRAGEVAAAAAAVSSDAVDAVVDDEASGAT